MAVGKYQRLPELSAEDYAALRASIVEHGVQVPIIVDEDGEIIDGHHRKQIADELGIICPTIHDASMTEAQKIAVAVSLNLDRRQLTREQRREILVMSVKAAPGESNRQHARRLGVDHKTVAAVRQDLTKRGEIPHTPQHTDSMGRQQPASKTHPPVPGPEGYLRPPGAEDMVRVPGPAPTTNRRSSLPKAYNNAIADLWKSIERLNRLSKDDRFSTNRKQLSADHSARLYELLGQVGDVWAALEGAPTRADLSTMPSRDGGAE